MRKMSRLITVIALMIFSAAQLFGCGSDADHEHSYAGAWTVKTPATIVAEGMESNVCDVCGEEVTRSVPRHEHSFSGAGTIVTPATETEDGEMTKLCDGCGETVKLPLSYCDEHSCDGEWTMEKAPTVNGLGKEKNYCSVCGAAVLRDIPKLTVTELKVTGEPYTTRYFAGELFNSYGLEISAVLSDGKTLVVKNYEVLPNRTLTVDDKYVTVKYQDITVDVPITVSKYVIASVENAFESNDGASLYIKGYCAAISASESGERSIVLQSLSEKTYILLLGADFTYEVGDKVEVYTTVASDSYGKYLVYAEENTEPEKTVLSKENKIDFSVSAKKAIGKNMAKELFADGVGRCDVVKFGSRFYMVKDGAEYYIHFNENATDKDGARLESGKVIRLEAESLGAGILDGVLSSDEVASYPGALVVGNLSAICMRCDEDSLGFELLSDDLAIVGEAYTAVQKYIVETAYAFYYKVPYVDYDQYNARRNNNPDPEDATAQQRIYLDCSSYVNAVYFSTFGANVMPYTISNMAAMTLNFANYAAENQDNVDVVGYFVTSDYRTEEERQRLLNSLYS